MADNSTLPVSVGTEVFANDDVSSVKYPRVKLVWGVDGVATDASTTNPIPVKLDASQIETGKYKAFPNTASTTTTLNGSGSGATGDFLSTVTIVPETLNPGSISIKDGSGSAIVIFAGGTASVLSLVPFTVNLGYTSTSGAWQIVTGSGGNVHGVCGGNFT